MEQTRADVYTLFQRCIAGGVVEYWERLLRIRARQCVYNSGVVIWLMILQHLQPRATLAAGVEAMLDGAADGLMSRCGLLRRKRSSPRTGGYSLARQRLPKSLCLQVMKELVLRLREILLPGGGGSELSGGRHEPGTGGESFVVQGISASAEPARARPLAGAADGGAA